MKQRTLLSIILTGSCMVTGCVRPTIQKHEDLTGDGIPDVMLDLTNEYNYLFIGQANGKFVRARQHDDEGVKYFKDDSGTVYFFDGEFYRISPKEE